MVHLLHSDPSQTIILAGSGRSGTTWLGNILAANPNVRSIFEPFDYRRVPEAASLPLRPYARPGDANPEWKIFVRRVLNGQVRNAWVQQQGRRWWAWRNLVKEIRINLLLAWIDHAYSPKIVFMTRHPCAVVLSRLRLKWETHLDVFLSQPQLVIDYLEPYVDIIQGAQTPLERHAVMWCVENLVPLRQLSKHRWLFCTYEQLCCNPNIESERILAALGIRNTWFTQHAVKQISMVTRPDSAIVKHFDPLTDWQRQLSKQDITNILRIVRTFGITLYDDEPIPHPAEECISGPERSHISNQTRSATRT